MYQAFGLLKPDTDFSLESAALKLAAKFPGWQLQRGDNLVTLAKDDWEIHMTVNRGPEVLQESRDMAETIAGEVDGAEIASCASRVEVASDIPDPEMDHFDDYLGVIEVLMSFRGLIAVDPQEPSLL